MTAQALGVGLVWWPALDEVCRPGEGLVDVIEVEPETFWVPAARGGTRSLASLALAHLGQPKLLHSVGVAVGGTCMAPAGHLAALAADVAAVRPAMVSAHLSVMQFRPRRGARPRFAGFMLPPVQSAAGVALAAANIRAARAALGGRPFAVETAVSYLPPLPGEWPDGAYVAAVAEAADCGILLDLHNVECNARNGRQGLAAFCDALPPERVWELHLAGGLTESGFRLDAHSGPAEDALMAFAASLVPRLPNLRAIIFEIQPERVAEIGLSAVATQLRRMRDLWDRRATRPVETPAPAWRPDTEPPLTPEAWDRLLGGALNALPPPRLPAGARLWWQQAAPAIALYRKLVGEGRASAVAAAAPATTRALLRARGGPGTRALLATFWRQSPQGFTAADEAHAFLRFLAAQPMPPPALAEAIAADRRLLAGI